MSNSNTIFAIAKGTPYSATSFDGTNFELVADNPGTKWRVIAGTTGKFLFGKTDYKTKPFLSTFSITDNTTWNLGVLPATSSKSCIMVVSANTTLTSFDGAKFLTPGNLPETQTYYVLLTTRVSSKASFSRSPKTFLKTLTAVATCSAFRTVAHSSQTHYRTFTATVSSVASFLGVFKW